jgi:tetratricopeptide (TPR) repeat protein
MNTDRIDQQERGIAIVRLRRIFNGIQAPEKSNSQWSVLESNLFARLGGLDKHPSMSSSFFRAPLFSPIVCAFVVVVAAITLFSFFHLRGAQPFPEAGFLGVQGNVLVGSSKTHPSDTLKSPFGSCAGLCKKGLSIATLEKGSCILRIDKGTAVKISGNALLTFDAFDCKNIVISLSKGSILAKVSKRSKDQTFIINTPAASCRVIGTIFKVSVDATGLDTALQTELIVYEGKVKFTTTSARSIRERNVTAGQDCRTALGSIGLSHTITEAETPIKDISMLRLLLCPESQGPEKSGILDISCGPEEAVVMIDDSIAGKTPLLMSQPVGKHTLKLSAIGYAPWDSAIMVGHDSAGSIVAHLIQSKKNIQRTPAAKIDRSPAMPSLSESSPVALPEYVEAMIQLTIGEYQKSLGLLETIKNDQPIDLKSRIAIIKKINGCYAKFGDFSSALGNVRAKCDKAFSNEEKQRYLWEMSNIMANCMSDYDGARRALLALLAINSNGNLAAEAYLKLAEVYCMLEQFENASEIYASFLSKFPSHPYRDKALFSLACVCNEGLHDYKAAFSAYSRIIADFPRGNYYHASITQRSECANKIGLVLK